MFENDSWKMWHRLTAYCSDRTDISTGTSILTFTPLRSSRYWTSYASASSSFLPWSSRGLRSMM